MTMAPKRESLRRGSDWRRAAGLAAAATSAEAGLSTLLLDENIGPGGQVFRAISSTPVTERNQLGADYWVGADLVQALRHEQRRDHPACHGLESRPQPRHCRLDRRRLGVRQGQARDPGERRAGAAVSDSRLDAAGRDDGRCRADHVEVVGACSRRAHGDRRAGPLLWLLAAQILRLGGASIGILDTTERGNYFAALPHAFAFLISPYFAKGLSMMREVRAKVQVVSGVTELAASGDGQLASVSYVAEASARPFLPISCCCSGCRAPTSIWRWRLESSIAGTISCAGRRCSTRAAIRRRRHYDRRRWRWIAAPCGCVRGRIAGTRGSGGTAPAAGAKLPSIAALRADLTKAERGRVFPRYAVPPSPQFRIPSGDTSSVVAKEVTAKDVLDRSQSARPGRTAQGLIADRHGACRAALRPHRHRADGAGT